MVTWVDENSGRPLLGDMGFSDSTPVQHFHPQLAVTPAGIIGCAFYEFGIKGGDGIHRIDVRLASTAIFAQSFIFLATVTEKPWDPLVDAPFSHGNPAVTFIGEYFGLDVSGDDFSRALDRYQNGPSRTLVRACCHMALDSSWSIKHNTRHRGSAYWRGCC